MMWEHGHVRAVREGIWSERVSIVVPRHGPKFLEKNLSEHVVVTSTRQHTHYVVSMF